jgi:hypothetical protein
MKMKYLSMMLAFVGTAYLASTPPSKADVIDTYTFSHASISYFDGSEFVTENLTGTFEVDATTGRGVANADSFTLAGTTPESGTYIPNRGGNESHGFALVGDLSSNELTIGFSQDFPAFTLDLSSAHYDGSGTTFFETAVSGDATLTSSITTAVPEPSTWAMMILGFAGVGFMAYRRKQNGSALSVA